MARVTFVQKAQQRYHTKPVIDPATGTQKITPVMRKDGTPKTTKTGREVVLRVTEPDLTRPEPNYTCDKCGVEIKVGEPYKHVTPKSGPYGGHKRTRCATCPTWQVWDLSSSLSARIAQIVDGASTEVSALDDPDEVRGVLSNAAEEIRSLAEEKREGASNIEDGFGHSTYQSEELEQTADDLDSWADDVEGADIPDLPEPEEDECEECGGSGEYDNPEYSGIDHAEALEKGEDYDVEEFLDCEDCHATGSMTPDEPTEDQMQEWANEVEEAIGVLYESPF